MLLHWARRTWWNKTEIKQNCWRSGLRFSRPSTVLFYFSFRDVRTREIKPTTGSFCSFISDVRISLKLKHWNSFAVLKNILMRLKQFRCFISVLFHHVRRALGQQKPCRQSAKDCGSQVTKWNQLWTHDNIRNTDSCGTCQWQKIMVHWSKACMTIVILVHIRPQTNNHIDTTQ